MTLRTQARSHVGFQPRIAATLLLALLLAGASAAPAAAQPTAPRLVVFEGFYRPT